jgi:methionine transaminase
MLQIKSKLPKVGTTIFSVMSKLAVEHNAINLSQGFPNFESSERLQKLVTKAMQSGQNQYAPMPGLPALCEQLAYKNQKLYGANINPATEITITNGASEAIFSAITALVHQGDEVIIIEPAYDCYRPAIDLCGAKVVVYEAVAPDFRVNWQAFAQLVTPQTRMIMVNNPQNPTATTFDNSDWAAMERITEGTDIILLSDEVYEHLVFDGQPHCSALARPTLWQRTIATYSFGKTFHNTGWKIGYCAAPDYLMAEIRKVHQFNVFSVTTPMQYALAEFLKDENEYLSLPNFYEEKRDFFAERLSKTPLKLLPCKGTYFQLASYAHLSEERDVDFAQRLVREIGVATIPISVFYESGRDEKILRFCFAKTNDTLAQAADRLLNIASIL